MELCRVVQWLSCGRSVVSVQVYVVMDLMSRQRR